MSKTLLLADDSTTIQRVVELTFAQEDIRVVSVADGEQAVKSIDRDQPDIVLADVGMPRLDGYSLSSHVKTSPALQHIPVLLLAGAFEPVDEVRARSAQCDGVLIKPFEPRALVTRVQELLKAARAPMAAPAPVAEPSHEVAVAVNGAGASTPPAEPGHVVPSWYRPERSAPDRPAVPVLDTTDLDGKLATLKPGVAPAATVAAAATVATTEPVEAVAEPAAEPLILDLGSFAPVHRTSAVPLTWTDASGPEPLELSPMPAAPAAAPTAAVPDLTAVPSVPAAEAAPAAPAHTKVSLATAFSALLAAEQSMPNAGAGLPPGVTEGALEDVVRRVLLNDDRVRRMVLEAAERMVKEEIERIQAAPDPADDAGPETE